MKTDSHAARSKKEIQRNWLAKAKILLDAATALKNVATDDALLACRYCAHQSIADSLMAYLKEYGHHDVQSHDLTKICIRCAEVSGNNAILGLLRAYRDVNFPHFVRACKPS